jgi:membrane protein DedA with SNARE-associated domain
VEHELLNWLVRYGAPLLFLAQVLGIIGLPIPDELLMTVAGALIAKGKLHPSTTVFAAVAGSFTGITTSYLLGRLIGITLLRRWFLRHEEATARVHQLLHRFGGWLLAFGYFIPGVRHLTAITAGSGGLEYRTFAAYAYPGGALWCTVFLSLGYFAGDRWHEMLDLASEHLVIFALVIIAALALYVIVRSLLFDRRRLRS